MTRFWWGCALVLATGCRKTEAPKPAPRVDAAVAVVDAGPLAAPAPPVGFADLALPSAEATKLNDSGVGALAKGKVLDAVTSLQKATELAPAFVLARYNLACALARSGDNAGAVRELTAVFEVDWIGFRAQAARDEDLKAFRESEPGRALFAGDAVREARYQPVIDRGVRALLPGKWGPSAIAPSALRVGVWDAATARFVAISDRRRSEFAAIVSSDLSYAVLVTGRTLNPYKEDAKTSDVFAFDELTYWAWGTAGVPLATTKVGNGGIHGWVRISGDALSLELARYGDPYGGDPHGTTYSARASFSPDAGAGKLAFVTPPLNEPPLDPTKPRSVTSLQVETGWTTHSWPANTTYRAAKLTLPSGKTIAIPAALTVASDPTVVASPSGDAVALVFDAHRCECGGGFIRSGAHRIVLVDTVTGTAKEIAKGTGVGAVRFDAGGTMFVQQNRAVFQAVTRDDPATWKPLPQGVLLIAPIADEDELQCCG